MGTPVYMAPEIWMSDYYNKSVDTWSLGICLYEMLTFKRPYTYENIIKKEFIDIDKLIPNNTHDFFKQMI